MNYNDKEFDKIINYKDQKAINLNNSSYLEDLSGLFERLSACVDSDSQYYFDDECYLNNAEDTETSYSKFIKQIKDSFLYGSSNKINIILGRAGIGKTLFLKKGFQQLIRDKKEHTDKYIFLGVDFKNIDQDKTIEYYKNIIYDTLEKNEIDNIRNLNDDYLSEFNKVYNKKYNGPIKTPNSQLYPVKFFCEYIYSVYDKPCIIVFDNIDLANVPTQNDIFKATVIVCDKLYQLMTDDNKTRHYLIYFAMRPETFKHREEGKIGKIIHFPLPNILKICIKIIKKF